MMNRIALAPPRINSVVAAIWRIAPKYFTDAYRPELHYMRGPGPKWREKHQGLAVQTPSALPSVSVRQASTAHILAVAGLATR